MPNLDNREFDSLYELTRQDYTDRNVRLHYKPYNSKIRKRFLGYYDNTMDLEELKKQQEHDIYNS